MELSELDQATLRQFSEHGADLTKPRHTLYWMYFEDEFHARSAADDVSALGLGFRIGLGAPKAAGYAWALRLDHPALVLDDETVHANTAAFGEIAAHNRGQYDGWEAAVTHVES